MAETRFFELYRAIDRFLGNLAYFENQWLGNKIKKSRCTRACRLVCTACAIDGHCTSASSTTGSRTQKKERI